MTERPFPAEARWLAVGLNVLLLLVEGLFLIPRWVGEDEIVMVWLTFGAAFVNLTIFVDYYRRGMVGKNRKVRAGDLQPLPTLVRWGVIALNLFAVFSQLLLLLSRGGVNLQSPQEVLVTSLLLGTPVVSLAVLLDYNRRRV
jgi:hypothetical protein